MTETLPHIAEAAELRALASKTARRAGELAVTMRAASLHVAQTKSTEFDVATDADLACEQLLRQEILRARPDDGILGEEGDDVPGSSGLTWVIDPIDGTTNFLYGLADWAVSVAVVAGPPEDPTTWQVIAGSVFQPDHNAQYDAGLGLGVQLNGQDLKPPATGAPGRAASLDAALLAVGFHYDPIARKDQAGVAAHLAGQVRDLRDHGATSVELCNVAAGRVDGYWEERLSPWDVAAGLLIAEESGCAIQWLSRAGTTGEEMALMVCGEKSLAHELAQAVSSAQGT